MATALTGLALNIRVQLNALATKTTDLSAPNDNLIVDQLLTSTFGDGEDENDQVWSDRVTLAGGASSSLDLNALTNAFGDTANFSAVKVVLIINRSVDVVADAPPAVLEIGKGASTPFVGWFSDASDAEKLAAAASCSGNGDIMLHTNLSTGWSTTGANILKILNLEAVDDAVFDIVIVGVNA